MEMTTPLINIIGKVFNDWTDYADFGNMDALLETYERLPYRKRFDKYHEYVIGVEATILAMADYTPLGNSEKGVAGAL